MVSEASGLVHVTDATGVFAMSELHFIEPLWLLALIPLALLLWWLWRADAEHSAWRRVVDARLLVVLQVGAGEPAQTWARRWPLLLLAVGWLLTVLALANPTFEREPVPAFRTDAARVVVLDLSRSMLADDLTPSRLERARYKVADIFARSADGQVGLVAFAGDAFAVSPLTDDAETIRAMLEALSPQIMPLQGTRPDRGLDLALELLRQAGARSGEVILLTDDGGDLRATRAAERLREAGHLLGVIGVGTLEGAPVPGVSTADGPVISRLDIAALEALAEAGGGRYANLSSDDDDLDQVLIDLSSHERPVAERDPMLAERWRELGPWITVLLLPLAALGLRRGWLWLLLLALAPGGLMLPQPALALSWADLWQRPEQQAARAFAAGELERARELASDAARAGSAAYRLGDYADAAAHFARGDRAIDHYNRGNALARDNQLEAALAAYDEALARDPALEDARYNRAQVEAALRAQAQQTPSQPSQSDPAQSQEQDGGSAEDNAGQQSPGEAASEPGSESHTGPESGPGSDQDTGAGEGESASGAAGESGQDASAPDPETGPGAGGSDLQTDQRGDRQDGEATAAGSAAEADADSDSPLPANSGADLERSEQAAADYREEAAQTGDADAGGGPEPDPARDAREQGFSGGDGLSAGLDAQEREARQAADQWLRRIPDDPAELLRRKFLYQYQTRQTGADDLSSGTPW